MKQEQEILTMMDTVNEATIFDCFILESMQRIGTYTVAKNEHGQLVPVTVRGSTVEILNNKDACLYWSDPLVLSQSWDTFKALMAEAFPALFRSESTQQTRLKKKDVLANLRLYQERGFTYEESVKFEQERKLGRLAGEAKDALTLFLEEARGKGGLGSSYGLATVCLTALVRLEKKMERRDEADEELVSG